MPGLFYDTHEFYIDFDAQMFYEEQPWAADGSNIDLNIQKCISPVNNVGPRLFKSLVVHINNQELCEYRLCDIDYFQTILNTSRREYENGDLLAKGFFKETAGHDNDMQPDQYRFTKHTMQTYNYNTGHQQYDVNVSIDKVPDKIAMTVAHKTWNTGSILINPHIMYKLPEKGKLQFYVNCSSMWDQMLDTDDHRSVYRRLKESLMPNNDEVMITTHDYDVNNGDTLTFTTVNKDGSITEDLRTAGLMFHLELPEGKNLDADRCLRFHLFDERTFSIQPNGQAIKDYLL